MGWNGMERDVSLAVVGYIYIRSLVSQASLVSPPTFLTLTRRPSPLAPSRQSRLLVHDLVRLVLVNGTGILEGHSVA